MQEFRIGVLTTLGYLYYKKFKTIQMCSAYVKYVLMSALYK